MKIFNVMMSRDLGGVQQAFLDYDEALTIENHQVINITSVKAKINTEINENYTLLNIASWCLVSKIYLKILVAKHNPDLIICHGNRAIIFANAFKDKRIPVIGVSHNYSYKHLKKCDYVITLTKKLKEHLIKQGLETKKLLSVPNMIRISHNYGKRPYNSPVVIGSFGRFVDKKGFKYLIEAIHLLKQRNCKVRIIIGGDGKNKKLLTRQIQKLGLKKEVILVGWIKNKTSFFKQIDIFCLPSITEPFGIILLEAMEHSKPVISTKSGGPEEIVRDMVDGLLVEVESVKDIADKLQMVIRNEIWGHDLAYSAYQRIKKNYSIDLVAKKLSNILGQL